MSASDISVLTLTEDQMGAVLRGGIDSDAGTVALYLPNSVGVNADVIEIEGASARFIRSPRLSRLERRTMLRHQQARWDLENYDAVCADAEWFQAFGIAPVA